MSGRRGRPARRRARLALVGCLAGAGLLGGTAGAQQGAGQLDITGIERDGDRAEVAVVAPPGTPPADTANGRLVLDGQPLPTTTESLTAAGTTLVVVVDGTVEDPLLRPLQGALIELARRLPPEVPVVLADTSGTVAAPGRDREALVERIAAIRGGGDASIGAALQSATDAAAGGPTVTVLIAASPERVPGGLDAGPDEPVWVALLQPAAPADGPAAELAQSSGTQVLATSDPATLLPTLATVATDLGGRYVMSTTSDLAGTTLEAQLPTAGGLLTGSVALAQFPGAAGQAPAPAAPADGTGDEPAPGTTGTAATESDDGGLPTWLVALVAVLALAAVAGLVVLLVRRRAGDRSPGRAAGSDVPPLAGPAQLPADEPLFGAPTPAGAPVPPAPQLPPPPTVPLFGAEAAAVHPPPPPAPALPPTGPTVAPARFDAGDLPAMPRPAPNGNGNGHLPPLTAPPPPSGPAATEAPPVEPVAPTGPVTDLSSMALPGQPAPHLFSVDPQPIDLRRGGNAPGTGDAALAAAEAAATEALAQLAARRAGGGPVVPGDLYLAVEAAASTWLVDGSASPADVARSLAPGTPAEGPVAAHLWALRRCLSLPGATGGRDAADRAVEVLRSPNPTQVLRLPPPAPTVGHAPTLGGLATETALIERVERYGRLGADAARTVLATGPARIGLLEPLALVVSPSLVPADGAGPGAAEPLGARSQTMLLAVVDAASRMLAAEEALVGALDDLAPEVSQALGSGDGAGPVVVALATPTVLTPTSLAEHLQLPEADLAPMTDRLLAAGVLREEARTPGGEPLWVVAPVHDRVTAPFAEPGLVTAPAREARRRADEAVELAGPGA